MKISKMIATIVVSLFAQQIQADDYRVLDLGHNSIDNEHPWLEVITDQTRWEVFYYDDLLGCSVFYPTIVDGDDPCSAPAPAVDFTTEQVVVGGLGVKPSTAYEILVSSVDSSGDEHRITIIDFAWCVGLTVLDYPMAAIAVPRTEKPTRVYVEYGEASCQ
jgi:hypothetical protein